MTVINTDLVHSHTFSEFLINQKTSITISYPKLTFIEKRDNREYVVKSVINDYMYELKQATQKVILDESQELKYFYRPKLLSYDIYNTTELYYVILLLNNICNIKEFCINPLLMLTKEDMADFMAKIYNAEKSSIQIYNS